MINQTQSRRSFLKVTATAGGGVLVGVTWFASCKPEMPVEIAKAIPSEYYEMNSYIKIGDTGRVTIYSANPEIGQNVKTSMPMIVAEELNVNWKDVDVEQTGLNTEWYKRQVAGGSQSIRQGWDELRMAGAKVRHMLQSVAAEKWEVDATDCHTKDGMVISPTGETMGYGQLAPLLVDRELPADEDITLKTVVDYKIIGKSKTNVDLQKIITGQPLYGIDTRKEGMQYAAMVRPPYFGAKLGSYEAADAKAVTGVLDVIKIDDKIAVIATNTWAAFQGCKQLNATWSGDASKETTKIHDQKLAELLSKDSKEALRKDGDVKTAFAEADYIHERIYEAPFLPHNCMEPMNFYASVTSDEAYLYGPIQTPAWTQNRVADKIGIPAENIKIDMSRMGGGFGRRLYGDFAEEAAQISQAIKAPVQLVFSREDDMTAGTYRPASKYRIQASVKDNQITGYKLTEACISKNMYDLIPNFFPAAAIQNYEVHAHALESDVTIGAWRAPYTNFLAFAEQSFFDELAEKLSIDPVQLRLDLLENAKSHLDQSIQYSPERMQEVIKLAVAKSNWSSQQSGVYQGFSAYYSHNTHVAEVATVVIEDDIPVVKSVVCAVDCGIVINPKAAENQVIGGVVDGVGHAMYGDLTFDKGKPSAQNFNEYRLIRMPEAPVVEVHFVDNKLSPTGLGEPSLPPAGGAIANAIYKATGKRLYKQPFVSEYDILG